MQFALRQQLLDAACEPYRTAGNFHFRWARGKLGGDPVFTFLLEQGTLTQRARVLDLGCGRGLLAAWFLTAERLAATGQWPASFEVPKKMTFRGVDLDAGGCMAGNRALKPLFGDRVSLIGGDMCCADLSGYDAITILDVLHYIPFSQQDVLLDQIRAALGLGGLLVTRIGNAQGGWRFRVSQWVDLIMANAQGHRIRSMYCRPLNDWIRALESRGFAVTAQPMADGTPFANVLLVAHVPISSKI
jgi:SAM-dependent methyltransferase